MKIGIGGFSFHRLLEAGKQDIFQYIKDSKALGATQLEPWNAQLSPIRSGDDVARAGRDPANAGLTPQDSGYLQRVRQAAEEAEMPWGCLAVDGAHVYEDDSEARAANRRIALRWLETASILGVPQVRIDAGGPEEMPDRAFEVIVAGYDELIARAGGLGIELLIENHWGPSVIPDNVVRLLGAVKGLGLLFDSHNWAEGRQREGWEKCARYARSTHFKTFRFDENGNEPSVDLAACIALLKQAGYAGCWGVESVPEDGDECGAVEKTIALIRRHAG